MTDNRLALAALAGALVLLAGCLPSSQKQNTRALAPADSASATVAASAPVTDLQTAWTTPLTEIAAYPTGIAWVQPDSANARLVVVETQDGAIHVLDTDGTVQARWEAEGEFPYLAGVMGDTVAVFARGEEQIEWVTANGTARTQPVPEGTTAAFVDRQRTVVRLGGAISEAPAALATLAADGGETARYPIRTAWRASGYVRPWDDRVLALSGYRPVVDVLTPETAPGATLDTLALTGFDNPQLVRSYQFMIDEVKEPPLLASSAVALGDALYVLNVRVERVRVDVYDREGRLQSILQGPIPTGSDGRDTMLDVYPADLAVRETAGGLEIAVLLQRPRGILQRADARVVLFRTPLPAEPDLSAPDA